jgi:hypothetical protein
MRMFTFALAVMAFCCTSGISVAQQSSEECSAQAQRLGVRAADLFDFMYACQKGARPTPSPRPRVGTTVPSDATVKKLQDAEKDR